MELEKPDFKCPKCGFTQVKSSECSKCGITFDKYNTVKPNQVSRQRVNKKKKSKLDRDTRSYILGGTFFSLLFVYSIIQNLATGVAGLIFGPIRSPRRDDIEIVFHLEYEPAGFWVFIFIKVGLALLFAYIAIKKFNDFKKSN